MTTLRKNKKQSYLLLEVFVAVSIFALCTPWVLQSFGKSLLVTKKIINFQEKRNLADLYYGKVKEEIYLQKQFVASLLNDKCYLLSFSKGHAIITMDDAAKDHSCFLLRTEIFCDEAEESFLYWHVLYDR